MRIEIGWVHTNETLQFCNANAVARNAAMLLMPAFLS